MRGEAFVATYVMVMTIKDGLITLLPRLHGHRRRGGADQGVVACWLAGGMNSRSNVLTE